MSHQEGHNRADTILITEDLGTDTPYIAIESDRLCVIILNRRISNEEALKHYKADTEEMK